MKYAKVENGVVVTVVSQLPENHENISGFAWLPQAKLAELGWLPIEEVRPPLSPYESYGSDPVETVHADRVTREFVVVAANLEAAKADRRARLDEAYAAATQAGFTSNALGSTHTYPSSQEAQFDLVGTVILGVDSPFACVDGAGVKAARLHTAAQIQQVFQDGAVYKLGLYTRLQQKLAAVEAATTVAQVMAIEW
jgi:hypothetical protein